jgi:two-component system OmpR family response regulator
MQTLSDMAYGAQPSLGHQHGVIVVDDDVSIRRLFADSLRAAGVKVHAAASGEEAIRAVKATPDACVVLADVRMPRMDGWDLERALRRTSPDLPVVLLTADRLLSIRGSVRDKPVSPADIEALVRTNCRMRRGERADQVQQDEASG